MNLGKKPFVEQAIETQQRAFFHESWFSFQDGKMGQEFYKELSCNKTPPEFIFNEDGDGKNKFNAIQGQMCFIDKAGGIANLYLVCNYYNEIGEDYFVFSVDMVEEHFWDCFNQDNQFAQWMVWFPNKNLEG